ncbi:hypothetical protein EVAR_86956_1 [Eumeta japonica]|uniref:Uncharacterized protein n=1 Tax=Eumeta variegata TaxID=151549 RepID=A0A4C1W6R3_EUMVA|nr:hypothetical protein EVAR_86956_1 [Eumeta japonica]
MVQRRHRFGSGERFGSAYNKIVRDDDDSTVSNEFIAVTALNVRFALQGAHSNRSRQLCRARPSAPERGRGRSRPAALAWARSLDASRTPVFSLCRS